MLAAMDDPSSNSNNFLLPTQKSGPGGNQTRTRGFEAHEDILCPVAQGNATASVTILQKES
jgi:hypothetical protein